MSETLKGEKIGAEVLGHSGGAYVKRYFKIDTYNYSWVSLYLRDEILRNKIRDCRQSIQEAIKLPVHKDELRKQFQSAIESIKNDRLAWFAAWLSKIQKRQAFGLTSENIRANQYIPPLELCAADIDAIFSQLDVGVKQADIDAMVKQGQKDIVEAEKIIERDLSPRDRWIHEDNGKPMPYPQGCRWTQFVIAWKKVASRYDGPVSVEGSAITSDSEMSAYVALGLDKIGRVPPLRTPYRNE